MKNTKWYLLIVVLLLGTMALVACLGLAPSFGSAQSTRSGFGDGLMLPGPSNGYVGLSLGKSKFDPDCVPGLSCDSGKAGFKVFAGGVSTDVLGAEIVVAPAMTRKDASRRAMT
mgnify:CR=1 FL=1